MPTDDEIEAYAELLFTTDQPNCKWADYNKPGWHVYKRYRKMANAVAERAARATPTTSAQGLRANQMGDEGER